MPWPHKPETLDHRLPIPGQNVPRDLNNLHQGLSRNIDPLDLSAVEVIAKKAFADTTVGIFADPARAGSIARTGLKKLAFQFVRPVGRRHSLSSSSIGGEWRSS